jgi:hypothetical protein
MVESHFHLEGVTIMLVLPNTNIMTIAVKLPTDPAIRAGIGIRPMTGTTKKDSARSRPEQTKYWNRNHQEG